MDFLPAELIKKKRAGQTHTLDEIEFLVRGFTSGSIPDYQVSAWLMAVFFKGMSGQETSDLTLAMMRSGRTLNFESLMTVDKHSTGGVGDKTSLILAPIAAAAGVSIPMIAGRGLGHTGGTLDKLESIPGFSVDLTIDEFRASVIQNRLAMIGQTEEICPADKKLYALRDVTATVESLPLICASIMSKKLAEGIRGLVLDVKYGSGAFMKTLKEAEQLATKLREIGQAQGKKVVAFISNMNQPLGRFAGNSLEIEESVAILKNENFRGYSMAQVADTRDLSVELAGAMIWLAGRAKTLAEGCKTAHETLLSGAAYVEFEKLIQRQGGDLSQLPKPKQKLAVLASQNGYLSEMDTEKIGIATIVIGAGRKLSSDKLEPTAGIEFHKKIGDSVQSGETIFTIHGERESSFAGAAELLQQATQISLQKPSTKGLIELRMLD